MADKFKHCINCKRDIASANYVIHSAHCERRIQLCSLCSEPVPRTEMEQHMEDNHSIDACVFCNTRLEKWRLEKHKEMCLKRPVTCNFCNLEFSLDQLDEHVGTCGTRTEKCSICNSFVKLQDQEQHNKTCQNDRHINIIITCEYCKTKIPADLLSEHVSACGLQTEKCLKCNTFVMLKDKDTHICKTVISTSHGKCLICNELVPWIDMVVHESCCRLSQCTSDDDVQDPKPRAAHAYPTQQQYSDSKSLRTTAEKGIRKLRQCPFCKERLTDLIAEDHFETCEKRSYNCEFCLKEVPFKHKQKHEAEECAFVAKVNNRFSNYKSSVDYNYPTGASGFTRNFEKKFKECPYCKEKFPDLLFKDHMETCDERPFQCNLCLKAMPFKKKYIHEVKECKFIDKVRQQYSSSQEMCAEDAPVYMRNFEKDSLEKNHRTCPYCTSKITEIKYLEHVKRCSENKKLCQFCGLEIPFENEIEHLKNCIGKDVIVDKPDFQTQGSKRNKKKNKKGKESETASQTTWNRLSSWIKKDSSAVKEYYTPQVTMLPCEFCSELFPDSLIIDHQSGCRPDLVSFPKNEMSCPLRKKDADHKVALIPEKRVEVGFKPSVSWDNKDSIAGTGALPKRNRFVQTSSGAVPGEFLDHGYKFKEPDCKRDYFNYPSGVPDYMSQTFDIRVEEKKHNDQHNPTEDTLMRETIDSKRHTKSKDKKISSNESRITIFNFNASTGVCSENINSSNQQPISPLPRISKYSFQTEEHNSSGQSFSTNLSPAVECELKAVGAERAGKKGIIQITRDTVVDSISACNETRMNYDTTNQLNTIGSTQLLNRFGDEKYEDFNANTSETWKHDYTEDDAKNSETFGNDFKELPDNFNITHGNGGLSDSDEYFYDAEENLKISNIPNKDGSSSSLNKDSNLDVYFEFLMKDKDELIESNNVRIEESPKELCENTHNCDCGNEICYCAIINQPDLGNNNTIGDGADVFEGTYQRSITPSVQLQQLKNSNELPILETSYDEISAAHFQCEERNQLKNEGNTNRGIEKRSSTWNEWRSKKTYDTDSD